jgi:hypothetical protein
VVNRTEANRGDAGKNQTEFTEFIELKKGVGKSNGAKEMCLARSFVAGWLLKKGVDGTKRLARTLAPPDPPTKKRQ